MTNREIIERIKSLYQSGVASDDNRMSDRLIYSVVYSIRAMLLKQQVNKKKRVSERNYEYLECIPLEKAEPHDCPCAPPSGCVILKSSCKLPRPISTDYGDYIEGVTSIDGSSVFSKTTWIAKSKKRANKYTSKTQDFFFKDDYLFITTPTPDAVTLKVVTVSGIFEDVNGYNCNFCEDCDDVVDDTCVSPMDKEFKMDSSMIENLISLAVQELVRTFSSQKDDKINNANDDIQEQSSQYYSRRPIQ